MVNITKSRVQEQPEDPARLVGNAMRAHFLVLWTQGRTGVARTAEEFYGFSAKDVIEMHFEKREPARGLWFRLRNGRVINAVGKASHPAPSHYAVPPKKHRS